MEPQVADRSIRLQDGRRLQFREFGDGTGKPVVALHGTPGSRLKFASAHAAVVSLGLRLIAPDRWGYGGSDPPSEPVLSDYGRDIEQLADALGIRRFGVLGVSGGGPFAVAVAARLGDRVTRLALAGPVGPIAGEPLAGISAFHRFCFGVLPRVPGAYRVVFSLYRALLLAAPDTAVGLAVARAKADDRRLMADPRLKAELARAFRAGLAVGVAGPVIDMQLMSRRWDLALGKLAMPVRIWQGAEDRNVPLAAVRRLAEITGATLTDLPGQGHFWIAADSRAVLGWLARS